jgi:hypothetical protein
MKGVTFDRPNKKSVNSLKRVSVDTAFSLLNSRNWLDYINPKLSKNYISLIGDPLTNNLSKISNKQVINNLFDEIEFIIFKYVESKYYDSFKFSYWKIYSEYMAIAATMPFCDEDFFFIRLLGRGGFGIVFACSQSCSGKLYAAKSMNKKRVKLKKSMEMIKNERIVLSLLSSPYIVRLAYAYRSEESLFLVLGLLNVFFRLLLSFFIYCFDHL